MTNGTETWEVLRPVPVDLIIWLIPNSRFRLLTISKHHMFSPFLEKMKKPLGFSAYFHALAPRHFGVEGFEFFRCPSVIDSITFSFR
jgi:hypothetical protein